MESVVVVPTVREDAIVGFLQAWKHELQGARILVIEDRAEPSFAIGGGNVEHLAWCDIDGELGDAAWIIPRGSGCIRSFGCLRAQRMRPDMIVTLDDDVRPDPAHPGFLDAHWRRLQSGEDAAWVSTMAEASPRGMPYLTTRRELPVVLNHGLWSGVPDFDAATQLVAERVAIPRGWRDQTIPRGRYFPMCSMNLAWRPEFTPAMYFLLMGPDHPFDRFGDIWGGVLAKRIADHLGLGVNSGSPGVLHERASNVFSNLGKESRGLEANETFWRTVDAVVLTADTVAGAYAELAQRLLLADDRFTEMRNAMCVWAELFVPVG